MPEKIKIFHVWQLEFAGKRAEGHVGDAWVLKIPPLPARAQNNTWEANLVYRKAAEPKPLARRPTYRLAASFTIERPSSRSGSTQPLHQSLRRADSEDSTGLKRAAKTENQTVWSCHGWWIRSISQWKIPTRIYVVEKMGASQNGRCREVKKDQVPQCLGCWSFFFFF